jgi:ATP-binding cassette subfamily C (CFTR/MRP) protein 5
MSLIAVGLRGVVSETSLGLALAYSMQLTALFQRCVQLTVDMSSAMTSTERVLEFLEVEHESNIVFIDKTSQRGENAGDVEEETHDDVKDLVVSAASNCWPSSGVIEFRNVEMCYRDNPPVLRGVSFSTRSGERIGIAGRTGSGKSSLMVALFRIVELSRGAIFIDGRDVSAIPLHELRSHMSIITQDAVIFTGTLRFQLDPFDDHSDLEVWEVLERVNLAEFVRQLPDKLLESVSGSGEVLSQGQKQLICIARALIKRTKLLIMDEATSSIDVHTDAIIQSFLEVEVRQRQLTVLTIAHRLKTILNYDRILVLAEGKVIEFASPEELLQDSRSAFYSMAHQFEST